MNSKIKTEEKEFEKNNWIVYYDDLMSWKMEKLLLLLLLLLL